TGKTEAGATSVDVHFEGVRRAATVASDGTWSVTFGPGEIAGGEFSSAVTVRAVDAAGNVRIDTALVAVDSIAPEAARITGATHGTAGALGLATEGDATLYVVDEDGHSAVASTSYATPAGQMHFFDAPLPDGSTLVVSNMDAAGNRTDAL